MTKKDTQCYIVETKVCSLERFKNNATDEELENWNTKRTEKLSKLTAMKEGLKQKLAGMSELKLRQY